MLLEKIYAETVNVRDPDTYCAAPKTYVETYLRQHFVGRCVKGAYIISVLDIMRLSDCRMKETNLSGEAYVDVEFRAQVSVLGQWDILTGVQIINRAQLAIGKSEVEGNVVATLMATPEAESVKVGQMVPIRVLQIQYTPNQNQATAVGTLLTCDKGAPTFHVEGRLSARDLQVLRPLADRVKSLLDARAELVATRRDDVFFFENLLYSYAGGPREGTQTIASDNAADWEGPTGVGLPAGVASVNLLDFLDGGDAAASGYWSRDLALFRSSPLVSRSDEAPARGAPSETPQKALMMLLQTIHNYLKAVNEMVSSYATSTQIDEHKNVWLAMRSAQLPPP